MDKWDYKNCGPQFSGTDKYGDFSPSSYLTGDLKTIFLPRPSCQCPLPKKKTQALPNNRLVAFRIEQLDVIGDTKLTNTTYTDDQLNTVNRYLVDASHILLNPQDEIIFMAKFPEPNKSTVLADAEDAVVWTELPNPTHFVSYQSGDGASNEWDVTEGIWEATFNPAGTYYFILTSPRYEDTLVKVNAVDA